MTRKIKVYRTLRCHACLTTYRQECYRGDPIGDCPYCSASPGEDKSQGVRLKNEVFEPRVYQSSQKSRDAVNAVDFTYKMVESDYGITNLKDNAKAGEISAIVPDISKEMQAAMPQGGMFNNQANIGKSIASRGTNLGLAAAAKAERIASGIPDAMSSAMKTIKSDTLGPIGRTRRNPVAR